MLSRTNRTMQRKVLYRWGYVAVNWMKKRKRLQSTISVELKQRKKRERKRKEKDRDRFLDLFFSSGDHAGGYWGRRWRRGGRRGGALVLGVEDMGGWFSLDWSRSLDELTLQHAQEDKCQSEMGSDTHKVCRKALVESHWAFSRQDVADWLHGRLGGGLRRPVVKADTTNRWQQQ